MLLRTKFGSPHEKVSLSGGHFWCKTKKIVPSLPVPDCTVLCICMRGVYFTIVDLKKSGNNSMTLGPGGRRGEIN